MIRFTFLLALAATLSHAANAGCDLDSATLGARYEITHRDRDGEVSSSHFTLWRAGGRVAHQHEESGVMNIWVRTARGDLYLTRYFDEHRRGIEYQPADLRGETTQAMWQRTRALLAPEDLRALASAGSAGSDCERVEQYRQETDGGEVNVQWRPELQLVQSLARTQGGTETRWVLLDIIEDPRDVAAALAGRDDYAMVDYADIGDNESDPFLAQMIHLGFTGPTRAAPASAGGGHHH